MSKFDGRIAQGLQNRVAHAASAASQNMSKSPSTRAAADQNRSTSRDIERSRTLAQAQALTKLSERREQKRSETRAAKELSKSPGRNRSIKSGRSKSSGKGSAKAPARKVNAGGQAILSKSTKDLQSSIQGESDLTRALRPGFSNILKKGEGAGGGAKPSVEKERSIGYGLNKSPSRSPQNANEIVD